MEMEKPTPGTYTTGHSESVWDYPRPPRLEAAAARLKVMFAGITIADTERGLRMLETSHPPVYYIPVGDVTLQYLEPVAKRIFCEFKGTAAYWDIAVGERRSEMAAWSYPDPSARYSDLRDHFAFYGSKVDTCWVGDEIAISQPGEFYGGWITSAIVGPFKGGPGTFGW